MSKLKKENLTTYLMKAKRECICAEIRYRNSQINTLRRKFATHYKGREHIIKNIAKEFNIELGSWTHTEEA